MMLTKIYTYMKIEKRAGAGKSKTNTIYFFPNLFHIERICVYDCITIRRVTENLKLYINRLSCVLSSNENQFHCLLIEMRHLASSTPHTVSSSPTFAYTLLFANDGCVLSVFVCVCVTNDPKFESYLTRPMFTIF